MKTEIITEGKSIQEEYLMRPINIKKDYDELVPFYDQIFEKELSAKGVSVRLFLDDFRRMMPFFKVIGIFSKNFRHTFDGFVYENEEGKIVSTVNVGYSGNYWEIAMVATHPEHRRKGLAKKLIVKSLEHAKTHNAKQCVLEVLEQNDPAYNLYKKMGFIHFDTMMKLKLEKGNMDSIDKVELPEGYTIRPRTHDRKTGRAMYELEDKATPEEVLNFLPVNKLKHQKTFLMRLIRPLFKLILGAKATKWLVYSKDKLVGILFIEIGRSDEDCHNMELIIDPDHYEVLTAPLINYALNHIKDNTKFDLNTITIIRKSDNNQYKHLKNNGFNVFETNHILGIKLNKKEKED
ncbi:MAG: GNAT family N-acetyltransferase [Asgard group archaeon]|nr:GNAT family N-acetyltransferase [Asgard group archaeon]